MKKGFILLTTLFLVVFVSFLASLSLHISSYQPRTLRDLKSFVQASLLLDESYELSKYLLSLLKNKDECLGNVELTPFKGVKLYLSFIYPQADCINGYLSHHDKPLEVIMVNASVGILQNKPNDKKPKYAVNESVFLRKAFFIYPTSKTSFTKTN